MEEMKHQNGTTRDSHMKTGGFCDREEAVMRIGDLTNL